MNKFRNQFIFGIDYSLLVCTALHASFLPYSAQSVLKIETQMYSITPHNNWCEKHQIAFVGVRASICCLDISMFPSRFVVRGAWAKLLDKCQKDFTHENIFKMPLLRET